MIGSAGLALGMRMERSQRKLAREWKKDPEAIQAEMSRLALGDQGQVDNPPAESALNARVSEGIASQAGKGYRNAYIGRESIALSRAALRETVLRRTGESLMPGGLPVLTLCRVIESIVWTPLWADEMAALAALTKEFVDDKDGEGYAHQNFRIQTLTDLFSRTAWQQRFTGR